MEKPTELIFNNFKLKIGDNKQSKQAPTARLDFGYFTCYNPCNTPERNDMRDMDSSQEEGVFAIFPMKS